MFDILYNALINYSIFNITFYTINLGLFIIDYNKYFDNNKIQKKNNIMTVYKNIIKTVTYNSFIAVIPLMLLSGYYESVFLTEFSFNTAIMHMIISRISMEVLFYAIHRLFHLPLFYKLVHKKHHEVKNPIGIATLYMSLPDLYIGNALPLYLPLVILSAHPITIKLWIVITTFIAVIFSHSGFSDISDEHDYHHSNSNKNFGTNLFMDKLCGTYYFPLNSKNMS